jgi:hypothetical protein
MRFDLGGGIGLGGLWALWLLSESGSFVSVLDLICFLNMEKTDRRFRIAGGELVGTGEEGEEGEEGGLDRGASSDHISGGLFGLEVAISDESRGISESMVAVSLCGAEDFASIVSPAMSTRLRLVGGSSS